MEIKLESKLLDIIDMKERMDVIVFDYMDTSNNWSKAYKELDHIFTQLCDFYKEYVSNRDGEIPSSFSNLTANTYWTLFANLTAGLAYFKALASYELQCEQGKEINCLEIEQLLLIAGYGNSIIEEESENESADLVKEVLELYRKLPIQSEKIAEFEKTVNSNKSLNSYLAFFYKTLIKKN